eukprot:17580-Heterococcus_DN1.PRE.3
MNPYDVVSVSFKKPGEPKPLHSRTDSFLVQNKKKKLSCSSGCRLRVHGTCDKSCTCVRSIFLTLLAVGALPYPRLRSEHIAAESTAHTYILRWGNSAPCYLSQGQNIWGLFKCVRRIAPTVITAPATAKKAAV